MQCYCNSKHNGTPEGTQNTHLAEHSLRKGAQVSVLALQVVSELIHSLFQAQLLHRQAQRIFEARLPLLGLLQKSPSKP